jgi:hypothetical protein
MANVTTFLQEKLRGVDLNDLRVVNELVMNLTVELAQKYTPTELDDCKIYLRFLIAAIKNKQENQ